MKDQDAVAKDEIKKRITQDLTPGENAFFYAYLVGHLSTQVSQQVWELACLSAQKHILEKRHDAMEAENARLKTELKKSPAKSRANA